MGKDVRLSQCMIVKNEEKNIRRALTWGKGYVTEQIVVDTGSSDQTAQIAESMGAKVFTFPWIDDFSAAKNFAIEKASGNWIAFLDADEYYEPADIKKLYQLLKFLEKRMNHKDMPHIISNTMAHLNNEGKIFTLTTQDRVFRNLPEVRYVNRIHEKLICSRGPGLIRFDATKEITILHTGYADQVYRETNKLERNIRMLQKELEENPQDCNCASYLGDALMNAGREGEAEAAYYKVIYSKDACVSKDRMNSACLNAMKLIVRRCNPEEEAKLREIHQIAVRWDPTYPDTDYMMGVWLIWNEKWLEGRTFIDRALDKLEAYPQQGALYLGGNLKEAYTLLTMAAQKQGDRPGVVKFAVLALRLDRYADEMLLCLLEILQQDSDSEESAAATYQLLGKLYDFGKLRDKLVVYKCAKMVGFSHLKKQIENTFTQNELEWLKK